MIYKMKRFKCNFTKNSSKLIKYGIIKNSLKFDIFFQKLEITKFIINYNN